MEERSWLKGHWKQLLNAVTLLALLIVIVVTRHQLVDTFKNLGHVRAWALLLIIPIEIINYHAQAKLYQKLFRIVGCQLPYRFLYKASLELNFVNHVFPSGGVTGLSYFTLRLRNGKQISSGKATLMHIMKLMLYILSFELVLLAGFICLLIKSRVNGFIILVTGALLLALLVGTFGFIYIIGSRSRINNFFTALTQLLNRLIHFVRPRHPETISIVKTRQLFNDFHDSYCQIQRQRAKLQAPFWYALLANLTEIAAVYVVYIAFGKLVNVGAVVLAYAVANFAGAISVLPGGVGVYEGLMTAVLAATGISPAVSLPVTVMYRVVNTVVQVPLGYYLYQRAVSVGEQPPVTAIEPQRDV